MTHSYSNLFEQLISYSNIKEAIRNAAKRKRRRNDVQYILEHEEEHICNIIYMLESGSYKPQSHKLIRINDGTSKKERFITQPYFFRNQYGEAVYEQIVHHAVIQILKPIFMKSMYFHSNGSIPERGCHRGKKYLAKHIEKYKDTNKIKYFFKADIRHFYQSVNTNILKEKLSKIIHDDRFLKVVFAIIDSNVVSWEGKKSRTGLPIGFYPSQWFANFYLTSFDHYIKEELGAPYYARYMDDLVIVGSNKKELAKCRDKITIYLKSLGLELKENHKIALFDYKERGEPIDFMGFKFYRDRTVLRKHLLHSTRRAALKVNKHVINGTLNWYIASRMLSYLGWFKHTNTYAYFKKYIEPIAHIKACKKAVRQHDRREYYATIVRRNLIKRKHISRNKGLLNRRKYNDNNIKLEDIRVNG